MGMSSGVLAIKAGPESDSLYFFPGSDNFVFFFEDVDENLDEKMKIEENIIAKYSVLVCGGSMCSDRAVWRRKYDLHCFIHLLLDDVYVYDAMPFPYDNNLGIEAKGDNWQRQDQKTVVA